MKIRRGAEFRRDRRQGHAPLLLGSPDQRPPILRGLKAPGPFGGPRVGHLRSFLVSDASVEAATVLRGQPLLNGDGRVFAGKTAVIGVDGNGRRHYYT
jgi:hypothetical protein